jgi:hypothetical protein
MSEHPVMHLPRVSRSSWLSSYGSCNGLLTTQSDLLLHGMLAQHYGVVKLGPSTINVPAMNELTHEGRLTCLALLT